MEPVREGPSSGGEGQAWGPARPDPSWPIPLPRRWFSIQNSQLVYQKKLKVRWAQAATTGASPPGLGVGDRWGASQG